MRRRDALILGGAVAVALAVPPYLRRNAQAFTFEPLNEFDGFRRLVRGPITSAVDIFSGLSAPAEPLQFPDIPICEALFGTVDTFGGALPLAVFGDVNCPNCAAFEGRLERLLQDGNRIRLIRHQLPLLGPRSVWASRVILAAGLQGAADVVYSDLLQRVLRPGPAGIRDVADRHQLDADKLWEDANGTVVADLLGKALGLGSVLGIPGTPASMVGRTLVIGAIPEAELIRLIELERAEPVSVC